MKFSLLSTDEQREIQYCKGFLLFLILRHSQASLLGITNLPKHRPLLCLILFQGHYRQRVGYFQPVLFLSSFIGDYFISS